MPLLDQGQSSLRDGGGLVVGDRCRGMNATATSTASLCDEACDVLHFPLGSAFVSFVILVDRTPVSRPIEVSTKDTDDTNGGSRGQTRVE